jgi:hypothetical protein
LRAREVNAINYVSPHGTKRGAFTLLETLLALFLVVFISGMAFYLFTYINSAYKLSIENETLDRELRTLTETIFEDFSCVVLIDKRFPSFEFDIDRERQDFFVSFFSSNNEEHVTKAIQYHIKAIGESRRSFSKIELSVADSLFIQNTLDQQSSLRENIAKYPPSHSKLLCNKLLDFNVRVAVRTPSGGVFISPTNTSLAYKNGCLFYKKNETTVCIKGTPLFIDITARALTKTAEQKFMALPAEYRSDRSDFLAAEVRKSFRRVSIRSHYF